MYSEGFSDSRDPAVEGKITGQSITGASNSVSWKDSGGGGGKSEKN